MQELSLFGFFIAVIILAATPGPGMFATISLALSSGFSRAMCLVAGIILGDLVYLMMAIFGLSMIARVLGDLFIIVKIGGGLYLIWLGIKIWSSDANYAGPVKTNAKDRKTTSFISGLIITLSNPKVILFYCGFLPAFMDVQHLSASEIIMVASVVAFTVCVILAIYAYLAAKARRYLAHRKAGRVMNRIAAGTMIGAGVAIAAKS